MSKVRILIAEDEDISRDNLEYFLKKNGYETVAVPDGAKAIQAPEKYREEAWLIRGNIFSVGKKGRRRHYEMTEIHESDGTVTVSIRPIKSLAWKGLVLAVVLIASWFIVQRLADWIFS